MDPQDIEKLDLARYGLAYLDGANLLDLSDEDMDKLLKSLGEEDISLNIPTPCTPYTVQEMLSVGSCRNCGKCCIPNPLNPENPGVEVFVDELRGIAQYLGVPYEDLVKETKVGKMVPHPFNSQDKLSFTRFLPLPCPYRDEKAHACRIYTARPIVCSIHPVVFTEDNTQTSIKANCDYGKEMIKAALKDVKKRNPNMAIPL